jgi:3-dehydroquinate dehydratase/shikimate dehydrogenase
MEDARLVPRPPGHLSKTVVSAMICVTLAHARHGMMIGEHQALAQRGVELVEFRIDYLARSPDLKRLLTNRPTPAIVTCRRPADGGKWAGKESERLMLLRAAIVSGADYVDVERDIAAIVRRYAKTKRIISHHDFTGTPDNLEEIYESMGKHDPDVIKIVTTATKPADCVRLLKLVKDAKIPTVAFCMGEFGQPSRILCGRYGAPFTYATSSTNREVAPGQLTFEQMQSLYQYDKLGPQTKLFGVLGDPIGHSLSPLLHNRAMQQLGIDGVYLPFRVPAEEFNTTLDAFSWLDIGGYSVTIPHKQAALAKYPDCDDVVGQIGAANTIYRDDEGAWRTANTDLSAALDSLRLGFRDPQESFAGKRALILGAGGAARAIAWGLVREGSSVVLSSRTAERATQLATELGCRAIDWNDRGTADWDLLVNCTPVGMSPNPDDSPFEPDWLRPNGVVFDTIYNPEQTKLLMMARTRGCRTVSGMEMFVRQAAEQFRLFTGEPAPLELFRETLRSGLSSGRAAAT